MDLPAYSRFENTPIITVNGKETFSVWEKPKFSANDGVFTLVVDVTYEGKPELISYDYYGTTAYAWVIMAYNNVRNTLNWPKAGEVIRFPNDLAVTRNIQ